MTTVIETNELGSQVIKERNIPCPAYDLGQWVVCPDTKEDKVIIGMSIEYNEADTEILYELANIGGEVSIVAEGDISHYYPDDEE